MTFGTAGAFLILFREAWKEDIHVFAAEGDKLPFDANTHQLGPPVRVAVNVLNLHPASQGTGNRRTTEYHQPGIAVLWVKRLDRCEQANLPDYILISAHARELVEADGLHTKSW